MSVSSCMFGGYVCICTVHAYVICMYISSCALHILGGMSESVQCMHMCYPYALHLFHFISFGGMSESVQSMHMCYPYTLHLLEGSIGQSKVICKVLCSGIQGISALVLGGSISQSRFICQVLCSGMQVISVLVLGGPLAKVGSSAKFCVVVCKSSLFWYWGSIGQSRFICQVLCSGM